MADKLPVPDPIAQQYSEQLVTLIKQKIVDAGGKISFADYMQHCLFAPGLGYYSAGSHKIGKQGDFTTAPEISSLFSRTLAQHINDVFKQIEQLNILEFGAGSGKMAVDILTELKSQSMLPEHYYIIEASADLRDRQEKLLHSEIPDIANRVVWLDSLPENFIGVILANEVCDAMPVHCLQFNQGRVSERYIETINSELQWCDDEDLSQPLLAKHANNIQDLIGNINYTTEVNLAAEAWLTSLAASLEQGAIFIIDYGYPQTSYYHPQRDNGTLMCYYQHQGHDNPLILQGIQDITAHINFTALAQTAMDNELDVEGFQSQADFLLAGGITELAPTDDNELSHLHYASKLKQLTLPSEMGESFKVLTLSKNLEQLLPRCKLADRRYSL
ncbi:MAG: SAM-dependent methyltransferase [Gammaproteobacteria bacterium]|nr:SAM-dependent methyltransferase [Gammaproteobacteria bacterium]